MRTLRASPPCCAAPITRSRPTPTFAVGEESEQSAPALIREVGKIAAPIDAAGAVLEPGKTARVDVVVRTRKIGHFFPAGTVDAFDVWLELQARDADGRVIFWSGNVADNGKGPVDPGAHFYRSYQLDANAQPHRQAQRLAGAQRALRASDSAWRGRHGSLPRHGSARARAVPISFTARLNYRKFSWYYTQFSYAGQPKPGQDPALLGLDHNGLEYQFLRTSIPANVSGAIRDRIPDLPIVTLAEAHATVPLGQPTWTPVAAQAGSRALERLGHRPAVARRSEGRRICVSKGDRSRARICRWLAERGAGADSGRRDRCRQAVCREGDGDRFPAWPHLVFQSRGPARRWRLRWRAPIARSGALEISARPCGAEPDRAHPVSQTPVRRRRRRHCGRCAPWIRKTCRCTTR